MRKIELEFSDLDQAESAIADVWLLLEANAQIPTPNISCSASLPAILSLSFERQRHAEWMAARLEAQFPAVMARAVRDPRSSKARRWRAWMERCRAAAGSVGPALSGLLSSIFSGKD